MESTPPSLIMECLVSPKTQKAENASPQLDENEDDIEFVGEAVLRPVLDCIDLVSSGDEEPSSSSNKKVKYKDHIDYQKERVVSTLDRLARHVEVEKQLKEDRNKAFKEKMNFQHAHGLQELEFIHGHSDTEAARLCVNQWLKMPGLKPGTVNSGRKLPQMSAQMPSGNKSILCPIMHCNKKFDNGYLLLGHLKRFDHSPCDPTVTLHGPPSSSFACIVCNKRFPTSQQYSDHCVSKASENDGHERNYPPQHIQFFACPFCFLLFSLRDECLQHMAAKNHFSHSFKLSEKSGTPLPLPFPAYAKNLLISLCKEVPFKVKCVSCQRPLRSHAELTAHFRTRCRNAGPAALSEKNICQVAEIFKAKGFCQSCNELFIDDNDITKHTCKTLHKVNFLTTMEQSVLIFCHTNKNVSHLKHRSIVKSTSLKRSLAMDDHDETTSKQKRGLEDNSQEICSALTVKTWMCECHLTFPSEDLVEKHIFSANRICHKCAVCGKFAENVSIIRLHMSRFHGGAHLANFLFYCQSCNVDLQKGNDVLAHVTEYHCGHSYFCEKYVSEDDFALSSDKLTDPFCNNSLGTENQSVTPMELSAPSSPMDQSEESSHQEKWQCCLCEEIFDSEDAVKQHCMSLESHHFHRFSCDLCKVTFRKIETLHRHCQDRHNNVVQIKYLCGFCGDLFFDAEEEFLLHFKGFHSRDYICVSETTKPSIKTFETIEESSLLNCGCREKYISKENRKTDYEKCQADMLAKDSEDLPDLDYLCTMTHIIMMDLDNWGSFFQQLPASLNQGTFIWGFQGGHGKWKQPVNCKMFNYLNKIGCFFLHPHCGTRREAADFAICVHVGRLDEYLPKHIPFTILSGDKGFLELENQLKMTQRTTRILDPHKIDSDMMCALLNSISDTAKENEEDSPMTTQHLQGAKIQVDLDSQLQEAIRRSLQEK
ncbi:E3 SUMO-protein ligase ZNF451-like isoform X4 [Sphaerodactylus townsendi]|uniref:E3 SUMO-protein ligase ZNF451-like isoform X4 n=1 Tax=Sphaerodactylus townsendi TaxID=933632 RepID=UPI002025C357|nr:E3 SUMO-protein ligase ZNF451-like isoform X4 [Sphaerodactylus townsendi]